MGPVAAILPCGTRLHLQHGPIDLIIGVDGNRQAAFAAAQGRFASVLDELVAELPLLRARVWPNSDDLPKGNIAQAMHGAVRPHAASYVTCMAAVAGAVADEILAAMCAATPLRRAYVNNGGDIALYLGKGQTFTTAMADLNGMDLGRITVTDKIGGIATSGAGGRSLSRGIADAVTVLADSAAQADAAATLIANAVNVDHPGITRRPARELHPDSDLGNLAVTVFCPILPGSVLQTALNNGQRIANQMRQTGLIRAAAIFLQGESRLSGQTGFTPTPSNRTLVHA